MTIKQIDFDDILTSINLETKALEHTSLLEEDSVHRSIDESEILFLFIKDLINNLNNFFIEFPRFKDLFDKEFDSYDFFGEKRNLIDLILNGEFLFEEKELFPITQDGGVSRGFLNDYKIFFESWCSEKKELHSETKEMIQSEDCIKINFKDLRCSCVDCIAKYRTEVRDQLFEKSLLLIEKCSLDLEENIEQGIECCSDIFRNFKSDLDRLLKSSRNKLKRSSVNKLEAQIKARMDEELHYPSEIATQYSEILIESFHEILKAENLSRDIVSTEQYERFFLQLQSNIWRNYKYQEREFKKLLKSAVLLKRHDISSSILKEYLGEFWLHADARRITRKIIYHAGPTNSGKTYHAIEALSKSETGCYLAPLRLLAGELYDTLNSKGVRTTLLTGEEVVETPGATHFSSTIEMAKVDQVFDCCVIDEIQMLTDESRGWAWTRALVNIFAQEVHICGDISVLELVQEIVALTGDELEVRHYERMTELNIEENPIKLGELEKGDAVIVFSRRNALKYKRDIEQMGFKVSIVYGRLSPEVRREQARKFDKEETDVIVSTDAISMGMNLPIRRIVFSTLSKYINSKEIRITDSEIKQIGGRAGRYGRFPTGYITTLSRVDRGIEEVQSAMKAVLPQKKIAMVGPDLDIFKKVNDALKSSGLTTLSLPEFLRLFNTMKFKDPFNCVNLKEMVELAEMVEEADPKRNLSSSEIFGFSCAPVNLGLMEHVQYYLWILNHFVSGQNIHNEDINFESNDIDYLETSIKCVELYQWLSRHFDQKFFDYSEKGLLENKGFAVEKLNNLLSKKIIRGCSSCGAKLSDEHKFNICETCFKDRRGRYRRQSSPKGKNVTREGDSRNTKKSSFKKKSKGKKKFSKKISNKK